jgi:hypothetical protein
MQLFRPTTNRIRIPPPYLKMTFEIPHVKGIKKYIQANHVDRIKDLKELIKGDPQMGELIDKKNLEMPEMYHEIMKINHNITVDVPSTSNKGTGETTIVVEPVVRNIKITWATKYKIMKPILDLEFEMVKTYDTNVTTEERQAQYKELDELRE